MAAYITFQPKDYFSTVLYTATGSSLGVTGVGFQPDLTWIKNRDAADFHVWTDAVRGVTNYLQSNDTDAEVTDAETLKSFDSDGFTVGTTAEVNTNTEDYVSWNWKAGTTTGISGSPSITPSSYSFNATNGFSIIAYTGNGVAGATLPHGLGVVPKMIIVKKVGATDGWGVYHGSMHVTASEDYYMFLNTNAIRVDSTMWNDTAPTSTLFSLGSGGDVNNSGTTFIAYCFADIKGSSKFGGYVGNGNSNGPFIYTGFRPSMLILKNKERVDNWYLFDKGRLGYNPDNNQLYPNTTGTDATLDMVDIVSNGFKLKHSEWAINADGENFIYAAFAEFPIVSSNDVPTVAR